MQISNSAIKPFGVIGIPAFIFMDVPLRVIDSNLEKSFYNNAEGRSHTEMVHLMRMAATSMGCERIDIMVTMEMGLPRMHISFSFGDSRCGRWYTFPS